MLMLKTWERRLYAAALVAVPLLDIGDDRINSRVLPSDPPDGAAGKIAQLTAIHLHDRLWQLDCALALAHGMLLVVACIGLLKLTRLRAPRLTAVTAFILIPGAIGMAMHSVFWNVIYGAMSRTPDLSTLPPFIDAVEHYRPFQFALVLVIVVLNIGLVLAAVTLWRSGVVPWWAALAAVLFPLNDFFGWDGWAYVVSDLTWLVGWGAAALALTRWREQPTPAPSPATPLRQPETIGS
jgi:hypothetical protein